MASGSTRRNVHRTGRPRVRRPSARVVLAAPSPARGERRFQAARLAARLAGELLAGFVGL